MKENDEEEKCVKEKERWWKEELEMEQRLEKWRNRGREKLEEWSSARLEIK